jgi:hypothetical protein
VLENATFTVEDGHFVAVGPAGEVDVPGDAARVDVSGMTIMPAINDAHTHLSTTRDALIQDLRRRAMLGIGSALSLGADGEEVPLKIRDENIPDAASRRPSRDAARCRTGLRASRRLARPCATKRLAMSISSRFGSTTGTVSTRS